MSNYYKEALLAGFFEEEAKKVTCNFQIWAAGVLAGKGTITKDIAIQALAFTTNEKFNALQEGMPAEEAQQVTTYTQKDVFKILIGIMPNTAPKDKALSDFYHACAKTSLKFENYLQKDVLVELLHPLIVTQPSAALNDFVTKVGDIVVKFNSYTYKNPLNEAFFAFILASQATPELFNYIIKSAESALEHHQYVMKDALIACAQFASLSKTLPDMYKFILTCAETSPSYNSYTQKNAFLSLATLNSDLPNEQRIPLILQSFKLALGFENENQIKQIDANSNAGSLEEIVTRALNLGQAAPKPVPQFSFENTPTQSNSINIDATGTPLTDQREVAGKTAQDVITVYED